MTTRCEVLDKATGELRACGEAVMFYYHFLHRCPVNLKKEVPTAYQYFLSLVDNIQFADLPNSNAQQEARHGQSAL